MKTFDKREYYNIEYHQLNELIQETYNVNEFECNLESSNDTCYTYHVDSKVLQDYDLETIQSSLKEGGCTIYQVGVFLQDLCNKGVIDKGWYLLEVWW